MTVYAVFDEANKALEGRTLADIGAEQGKSSFDVMLDLALSEGLRTFFMPPPVGVDEALWEVRGQLWRDDRTRHRRVRRWRSPRHD